MIVCIGVGAGDVPSTHHPISSKSRQPPGLNMGDEQDLQLA